MKRSSIRRLWRQLKVLSRNQRAATEDDGAGDGAKPFVEHLEDLRRTIVWSASICVVGIAAVAPFAPRLVAILRRPMAVTGLDQMVPLRITTVGGALAVAMRVILLAGFLVSLPAIIFVVGQFVFPGLKRGEKRALLRVGAFAAALFGMGVVMGYRWTLPIALRMMFNIGAWLDTPPAFWETADYMSFVLKLLMAFGLTFELPVVVLALGRMGILSARQLMDKRRHVIVGLLVLAMFLTPSDPFTMLLMAAPLIVLYEMCIWLIWSKERRATRRRR
jgi:sec-independent protein translocase protein TatC